MIYDAFNRRVEKRTAHASEAVRFLWDGSRLAERWYERNGTTASAITWHISLTDFGPIAQETDTGIYPVISNPIGLPNAIFDQQGQVVCKANHTLWGRLTSASNEDHAYDVSLRFPGQWADEEDDLHYNLNRYYDPSIGHYLSIDPIGLNGGWRTQSYVHNPVAFCDPKG